MTLPTSTGTVIEAVDFDTVQDTVDEILGLGENGYGLPLYYSTPVAQTDKVRAFDINNLIKDVDLIHTHITNVHTSTGYVITGTTLVSPNPFNQLNTTINYYLDDSRRYTCHPDQFQENTGTGKNIFYFEDSTSTRELLWGETTGTSVRVISHKLQASWPTRLEARYYFNQGSYLAWTPYHLGDGINDLDTEWANFITYLADENQMYRYRREEYINYSNTTTVYTSGTLQITVLAERSVDEKKVDFTIEFTNLATTELIVTPSVGLFNILV